MPIPEPSPSSASSDPYSAPSSDPSVLLLTRQVMDAPRAMDVAGGRAVIYSRGAPGREPGNQDAVCVVGIDETRAVLAVTDGAGGHAGGAEAAREVLLALAEKAQDPPEDRSLRALLLDGIETANARVHALGTGAAATLAAVAIERSSVRPFHVGDAEILVVGQRGRVRLQIVPHSPTGYAVEAGLLGADEAIAHEDRHLVSNVVGIPNMRIEMGSTLALGARDTVLLASDGLFDNLRVEEIVTLIRKGPVERAAENLAARVRRRMNGGEPGAPSKPDDLSFVLYRRRAPVRRSGRGTP